MYRFSGLFRDVVLRRRPAAHAEDLRVSVELADDLSSAEVRAAGRRSCGDGDGERAPRRASATWSPATTAPSRSASTSPRLWSPESPALYDLVIEVRDAAGALTEVIPQPVGIRRFAIEDGLLRLNGRRVVFHGVNRHEFGLQGRVMTREQTEDGPARAQADQRQRDPHEPLPEQLLLLRARRPLRLPRHRRDEPRDPRPLGPHPLPRRARRARRCPATGPSGGRPCSTAPRACSSATRTTRAS